MQSFRVGWCAAGWLVLGLSMGCGGSLERDMAQLCEATGAMVKAQPKDTARAQWKATLDKFAPKSADGKEFKAALEVFTAVEAAEMMRNAAQSEGLSQWRCEAVDDLSARAKREVEAERQAQVCEQIAGKLDTLAYALVEPMRAEIPIVVRRVVPQERQTVVLELFEEEVTSRLAMLDQDVAHEERKAEFLKLAGCKGEAPPAQKCEVLQSRVPPLTNNARVMVIGEAYGVALTRAGLEPALFVAPLQEHIAQVAPAKMLGTLQPQVTQLGELLTCTFE